MNKSQALELVRQHVKNENLVKHMIAAGAIMRALAEKFEPGQEDKWELAGLLHDIDWEETQTTPELHTVKSKEYLTEEGIEPDVVQAVYVHNGAHGVPPETMMEKALFCAEELTGLIVACALVQPTKKLADVKASSVLKKFKQPAFAAGVARDIVLRCDELLGVTLQELIDLELAAMQKIADEIGL